MTKQLEPSALRAWYDRLGTRGFRPATVDWSAAFRRLKRALGGTPWLPMLLIFFAVRALLGRGLDLLGIYDEGLLFTDAFLLRRGFVMYRDFHFCYPPGVVQVVRAVMGLHLPTIWTVRLLALLVRLGSAAAAGYLVGRQQNRHFCAWTSALVLILQETLGLAFYAYPLAILLGQVAICSWPMHAAPRWRLITSGLLLACISYVRLDLFVYAFAMLTAVEILSWSVRRGSFFLDSGGQLKVLLLSLLAGLLVLWLPIVVQSGISRPLHDLVIDLAERIMPGRKLPVPPLGELMDIPALNARWPAWLAEPTRLGFGFAVAAVIAGTTSVFAGLRSELRQRLLPISPALRILTLSTIFALCTLPQALRRFDYAHVAYGIPVTVAALMLAVGPRFREPLLLLGCMAWFVVRPPFISWADATRLWQTRSDEQFVHPSRLAVAHYVRRETRPGEPFFSGCYNHRLTMASSLDLHYLARRPGATQYMIFDPGTTNSVEGQREMIADLERTRPKIVLRGPGCVWFEPNESQVPGATLLDEYLDTQYAFAERVGEFDVWRPRARP